MPQEIALIDEFSVKGAVQHYGWLHGMSNEEIDDRFNFLNHLLDLPPHDRLIKNLRYQSMQKVIFEHHFCRKFNIKFERPRAL